MKMRAFYFEKCRPDDRKKSSKSLCLEYVTMYGSQHGQSAKENVEE